MRKRFGPMERNMIWIGLVVRCLFRGSTNALLQGKLVTIPVPVRTSGVTFLCFQCRVARNSPVSTNTKGILRHCFLFSICCVVWCLCRTFIACISQLSKHDNRQSLCGIFNGITNHHLEGWVLTLPFLCYRSSYMRDVRHSRQIANQWRNRWLDAVLGTGYYRYTRSIDMGVTRFYFRLYTAPGNTADPAQLILLHRIGEARSVCMHVPLTAADGHTLTLGTFVQNGEHIYLPLNSKKQHPIKWILNKVDSLTKER